MSRNKLWALVAIIAISVTATVGARAQMKKPEKVTIDGTLVDLSCAAKGMVMMGSDVNAKNDTHKTPKGDVAQCATMCLRGGQPAGIFKDGKITTVLLANASLNLYKFAIKNVEIQGFYAGSPKDEVKTFFPEKIRLKGTTDWTDVQTAEMH